MADTTAKLSVAQEQDESLYPYRTATLEIKNDAKEPITGISIRNSRGGATYIYDCSVPPGAGRSITVGLAATDVRQTFEVRPITAGGATEKPINCEIIWPSERDLVNQNEFVDSPLYRQWEKFAADQPGYNKKGCLLIGLMLLIVEAGVLSFVRGAWRKLLLGLAGAAVVFVAAWFYLGRQEAINSAEYYTNLPGLPGQGDTKIRTTVLLAHRTVPWNSNDWRMHPVYFSRAQMFADDAIINIGKEIRLTLRPGETRILRNYQAAPATQPAVPPFSPPLPSRPSSGSAG